MLLDQIIKYWNAATRQITLFGGLTLNGPLNGATTISGTALLIVVAVALDTMRQVDSQLTVREYEGIE